MNKFGNELLKVIATVAPTVATALGGPLAGVATRAVAGKLLGDASADFTDVVAAVAGATGEDLVKLKELELEFRADMQNAGIELERIAANDRDSARKRQSTTGDWTPAILALSIIIGYFAMLAYMMKYGLPEQGGEVLVMLVGALAAMTAQVGNYFFGSSTGSKVKDGIIADLKGAVK